MADRTIWRSGTKKVGVEDEQKLGKVNNTHGYDCRFLEPKGLLIIFL